LEVFIKKTFKNISEDKQNKIIENSIIEFSLNGYSNSSLNEIIKKSGISKGGMYKYISSKKDLYRYVIKYTIDKLIEHYKNNQINQSTSIKDLLIKYSEIEFDFYFNHENYYQLHINAFINSNEQIDQDIRREYGTFQESFFQKLISTANFNFSEMEIDIYRWVIEGINKKYYLKTSTIENNNDLKDKYIKELDKYLQILDKLNPKEQSNV